MKPIYIITAVIILCFSGCDDGYFAKPKESMIVEGWIEDGEFPVAIITKSLVISEKGTSLEDLSDHLLRWAVVRVCDGEDTVTLTGKYDNGYYPPFIYTTGRMRGKAGRHYTLLVDYKDMHAEASTYIPEPPTIDSLSMQLAQGSDTIYSINAHFADTATPHSYYQMFVKTGSANKQYHATYLGNFDSEVLKAYNSISVLQPHLMMNKDYKTYFTSGDTVSVKLARIDSTSFAFWNAYEKKVALGDNMMFPYTRNLPCNIKGALGYWCGYGTSTRNIILP